MVYKHTISSGKLLNTKMNDGGPNMKTNTHKCSFETGTKFVNVTDVKKIIGNH